MAEYPHRMGSQTSQLPQTSTMAIISLVSGIVSWFMLPIIGAIVAVITGHIAKRQIRESLGRLTGDGLATVGLVLGYIQLALAILSFCGVLVAILLGATPFLCAPFAVQFSIFFSSIIGN